MIAALVLCLLTPLAVGLAPTQHALLGELDEPQVIMGTQALGYRSLSVSERIQLVEDIWDSLVAENPDSIQLTPAQRAEVQRRLNEHDADASSAVGWEAVRSELFERGS